MPKNVDYPRIFAAGDEALLIEFGSSYSREVSRAVMAFDNLLNNAPFGVIETAPTIRSVLVQFDSSLIQPKKLEDWCAKKLADKDWYNEPILQKGIYWKVPVIYGGDYGPDIDEAAEIAGITVSQLIELHSSIDLKVLCLGFSPGLAYLVELPTEFAIPRRETYGRPVPAGSILIANRQTVLPATPIPTGWRRVGATPVPTFRPAYKNPFLLSPGDSLRFEPITEAVADKVNIDTIWEQLDEERT